MEAQKKFRRDFFVCVFIPLPQRQNHKVFFYSISFNEQFPLEENINER